MLSIRNLDLQGERKDLNDSRGEVTIKGVSYYIPSNCVLNNIGVIGILDHGDDSFLLLDQAALNCVGMVILFPTPEPIIARKDN